MVKRFDRNLLPASPNLEFEKMLWGDGVQLVAGVDEAGRGALAGPVAAAALILPVEASLCQKLPGVRDSKQMTPDQREYWAAQLRSTAVAYGIGFASQREIDDMGILPATHLAVRRALVGLPLSPQHLLLDYLELPGCMLPQTALVKGDARCLSIAGASILAKTARDEVMRQLDKYYPGYGLAVHKGYGTLAHRKAIAIMGLSPIHRVSFRSKPILPPENIHNR
ncbi:MAG: ribonuclease HII [Anaerolineales bacterium]|nr:ribonuclease HII [Anaerolineales bacterium]